MNEKVEVILAVVTLYVALRIMEEAIKLAWRALF